MQKKVLRVFSCLLAVVMLSVVIVPASADFGGGVGRSDFFTWTDGFGGGSYGGGAGRDQSKTAYDEYVTTLPAQGYTSAGRLTWQPTVSDLDLSLCSYFQPGLSSWSSSSFSVLPYERGSRRIVPLASENGLAYSTFFDGTGQSKSDTGLLLYFKAPVSGAFGLTVSPKYSISWCLNDGTIKESSDSYSTMSFSHFSVGGLLSVDLRCYSPSGRILSFSSNWYFPVYEVIPDTALSADTYNINTRPGSLVGLYGDVNGEAFSNNSATIINETNNTYYNPATGQTVPISNWSYDYSDRSYKVTLESGDTATITYGDENITIQEGDTVYNVYYLIDGSGSGEVCAHDWQESGSTDPTCTLPGKVTLTCTKCQQTKTETIPALGHDWQVKQTVTTQYDDTGQLTQEGYTIFECSRCHEQYKSPDGTIPPGGGSGTDPGEEDDGTTIGGLIEKLLSGLGGIVGGIIKGLLSLLTKAVEALAGLAELFTTFVGSLVELWGGFTSFLSAVFPFLPEEFVVIIELGLVLMIAAAVFRKFIS